MGEHDIGLIGLAVMGQNLALNMRRTGFRVAVYNRTADRTRAFMAGPAAGTGITAAYTPEDLFAELARPRKVILMVKAGSPTDDTIAGLTPLLDPGDLVCDGGNAFFRDTERRLRELADRGIRYMGIGISGGEDSRH